MRKPIAVVACILSLSAASHAQEEAPLTMAGVLEAATDADWQTLEQDDLLYMFLDSGVVVFELADAFAPAHIENVKTLARQSYWDGLAIVRSQDNYVVQWQDPNTGTTEAKSLGEAAANLVPEFYRPLDGLDFRAIDSRDAYADQVGFVSGFPVGTDGDRAWLAHCYGVLGAGRAEAVNSGNGAELYVVTGHSPRHLDRNVTLFGRVVVGIEHLSTLPRGTGSLGFFETAEEYVPIARIRVGSDLEPAEQLQLERMRTDTATFEKLVVARTNRLESWFADPAGHIELCNVPLPVRAAD